MTAKQRDVNGQPEATVKGQTTERVTASWNGEEESLILKNGDGCFSRNKAAKGRGGKWELRFTEAKEIWEQKQTLK